MQNKEQSIKLILNSILTRKKLLKEQPPVIYTYRESLIRYKMSMMIREILLETSRIGLSEEETERIKNLVTLEIDNIIK